MSEFSFAYPAVLWLLLALPAIRFLAGRKGHDLQAPGVRVDNRQRAAANGPGRAENGDALHSKYPRSVNTKDTRDTKVWCGSPYTYLRTM